MRGERFFFFKAREAFGKGRISAGFVGKALVERSGKAIDFGFTSLPAVLDTWGAAIPNDVKLVLGHGQKPSEMSSPLAVLTKSLSILTRLGLAMALAKGTAIRCG